MSLKCMVLSDLHCEMMQEDYAQSFVSHLYKDVDVLVICGDWVPFAKPYAFKVVENFARAFPNLISIKGNHCHYYSKASETNNYIEDIKSKLPSYCGNWYPLDKSTVTINNVTFAGATTWFPDTPDSRLFQMYINDFKYIKDFVPWVYEENEKSLEFWETVNADVWLSHHLPSYQAVSDRFKEDKLNCYFVEPTLEKLIGYKQPKYHLFGHSHDSNNFTIGTTKVISNPYGYESSNNRELNRDFKYDYVIEL